MATSKKKTVKSKKSKFVVVDSSNVQRGDIINIENKKTKKIATKKFVDIKDVQRGDIIYIENKDDATPYLLIDKGTGNERFILIEDLNTHFGYLYHFTTLYKSI